MVRIKEIQDSLLHLIGWRQSFDANDGVVSEALTQSESGLYYQDAHPLLTLQNLQSIAPDFSNISYPVHSTEEAYAKGVVVTVDGVHYKSLKAVPENIQITDTEYWVITNPFSEWLETKTKACITKAISSYVNEKVAKGTYKTLCEKKTLFDGTGRIYDVIQNRNNLVGFEIVPIRSKGVTTKINRIGLQFTEPGKYTIYIMHSSMVEPFYVETFTKLKANDIEWFTPSQDLYLPYEADDIDAGGSWYICYLQSQTPIRIVPIPEHPKVINSYAIRKNRDWSKGPCNECSRHEYETWRIWSKYLEVHPFYVNEELVSIANEQIQLWDIENNLYDYSTNYGLNLDISIACDITDFIIEQRMMFTDYLSKSLAVDFLREFAYNPNVRTNRHSINASRPDILYEIDGDSSSMKKSGMSYQLELAFKAINVSTEGIDRVCMPCINHGIKYRVV
jgi:hypothetical protein